MGRGVRILLVIAGLVMAGLALGLDRIWTAFGPADLGPVNFETLERRATPNDALACPPGLCSAKTDLTPPIFAVSAEELKAAMARVIASEPDVEQVEDSPGAERYIQRSRWMRFPDTVAVRYISLADGQSTLALYSRSQIGRGDLGVNRARLERWLDKLGRMAPRAQ